MPKHGAANRAAVRRFGLLFGIVAFGGAAWFVGNDPSPSGLAPYAKAPAVEPVNTSALPTQSNDTSAVEGAVIDDATSSPSEDQSLAAANVPEFNLDDIVGPGPASGDLLPAQGGLASSSMMPATAPNGAPWPKAAGYVDGYDRLRTDGLSKVTVDNGANTNAMFVKLVAIESNATRPVRQIFIPAGGSFTMGSVGAGRYDVRYEDLTTRELTRSDPFDITQVKDAQGTSFSNVKLTLFNVANGSMNTHRLLPSEF